MTKFIVDIPTEGGGSWKEIDTFETQKEAIVFCHKTFGADEEGRVSLITELEDEQDEGEDDPYAIGEPPVWSLIFEVSVPSGICKAVRSFQTEGENQAREEGRNMAQEMTSEHCTVTFIRLLDDRGQLVWEKPE